MSFEYPGDVRFACDGCALCCSDTGDRVRQILLLRVEAERIAEGTSKDIHVFADGYGDSEPYVYRMKKTAEGKCVFLRDGLCAVYDLRPLICKFYPFKLENVRDDKFVFTYTDECPCIGKGERLGRGFFEKLFAESLKVMAENSKG